MRSLVYEGQEERKLIARSTWTILAVKIQDASVGSHGGGDHPERGGHEISLRERLYPL